MNIFLFIAGVLIATLLIGKLLERIRVPWIFAALLIGAALAVYNPFEAITSSDIFELFAKLGMYLLLFLVGFELNMSKLKRKSGFIFRSAFFIIFLEGLIGSLIVHFVFGYDWLISFLVALSFATVGEAILVPILHEFKLINTTLGQSIIGIGSADDVIEILLLLFVSILAGTQAGESVWFILISLAALMLLTFAFRLFSKKSTRFQFVGIETLFLFILFVFFLFIGIGAHAAAAPLAAILAGVSVRLFIHDERLALVDKELKSLTYGLFAPLFFVWIGLELDIGYLVSFPLLVLLVVAVSNSAKILGSYLMGRKELGSRGSILLGIGLSVRFSTSIIIIKFLFDNQLIGFDIYSVVVASSIVFKFIIPVSFSWLATRWKFAPRVKR
jgi:Kef-type K+ transport system membrane component KefB